MTARVIISSLFSSWSCFALINFACDRNTTTFNSLYFLIIFSYNSLQICSNINSCVCHDGFMGADCNQFAPTMPPPVYPRTPPPEMMPTPIDVENTSPNVHIRKSQRFPRGGQYYNIQRSSNCLGLLKLSLEMRFDPSKSMNWTLQSTEHLVQSDGHSIHSAKQGRGGKAMY